MIIHSCAVDISAEFDSSAIFKIVTYLPDGNYQRMPQEALILDLPLHVCLVVLDLESNKYIAWHQHGDVATRSKTIYMCTSLKATCKLTVFSTE